MANVTWETYFDAVKKQDWKSAKGVLQQIAAKERNNPQTHLKMGDICQRTGDTQEAIAAYLHAAQILRLQGFAQKALATYKIALRLDPKNQDIIKRAEILMDEFEAVKATPHIPAPAAAPEPASAPVAEAPAAATPAPEQSAWLEPTSVAAGKPSGEPPAGPATPDEPASWLEATSLSAGATEEPSARSEQESEVPADAPTHAEAPAAPPAERPEVPAGSEPEQDDSWLESAYDMLDTKMFSGKTSAPEADAATESPADDPIIRREAAAIENIAEELTELSTPLSERLDASIPEIFADLPPEVMQGFMDGLTVQSFTKGQKVVEEGDSGDSMYIIRSGNARVVAHLLGRRVELAQLGDGDIFGEVGFLTGRPRTASVIADGPLRVYEINRYEIEKLIESVPDIMAKIEDFYEMRVRDTIRKIKE